MIISPRESQCYPVLMKSPLFTALYATSFWNVYFTRHFLNQLRNDLVVIIMLGRACPIMKYEAIQKSYLNLPKSMLELGFF